jgi:hypothetical protein
MAAEVAIILLLGKNRAYRNFPTFFLFMYGASSAMASSITFVRTSLPTSFTAFMRFSLSLTR